MKNFILIFSFLIIIPFSGEDTENYGCHSKKSETSENKTKNKEENSEQNEENKIKKSSVGSSSEIFCCPYLSVK